MRFARRGNTGQKTIFVLGAGASRDFGYPLGNELFHYAYRVRKFEKWAGCFSEEAQHVNILLPQVQKFLAALYPGLPMKDPFNDSKDWPPFEEVFTLITLLGQENFDAQRFGTDLISLSKTFRNVIFSLLTSCGAWGWLGDEGVIPYADKLSDKDIERITETYSKKERLLAKFLDELLLHSVPTFVSLNYDTLLDSSLNSRLSRYSASIPSKYQADFLAHFSYGFEVYDEVGKLHDSNSKILLLKPHGSLNLMFCQRCGKVIWRLASWYASMLNGRALCPFCNRNMEVPVQVPPLYRKDLDLLGLSSNVKRFIDQIREKVRLTLQGADNITIIGYSFPPYDYDFRYLFITGIMNNPKFPNIKIKVVDYLENKDNALERLRKKYYFLDIMIPGIEYECDGFISYLKAGP